MRAIIPVDIVHAHAWPLEHTFAWLPVCPSVSQSVSQFPSVASRNEIKKIVDLEQFARTLLLSSLVRKRIPNAPEASESDTLNHSKVKS